MNPDQSPLKIAPPKAKRQKSSVNIANCIICQTVKRGDSVRKCTDITRNKIIVAAEIRKLKHKAYEWLKEICDDLDGDLSELAIVYHRNCYATFTSSTNLAHVQDDCKAEATNPRATSSHEQAVASSSRTSRSSLPAFDFSNCIFCMQKTHKKDKTLHKIEYDTTEPQIRKAADMRNDQVLLQRLALPDFIAQDAAYHAACYVSCTCILKSSMPDTSASTSEQADPQLIIYDEAFRKLFAEIDEDLMVKKKALDLSMLAKSLFHFCQAKTKTTKLLIYKSVL